MSKKTIIDWFVVVALLLILPPDNRVTFDTRPDDWYGEVVIPAGNRLLVVAKNSSAERIDLGLKKVDRIVTLQGRQQEGLEMNGVTYGLPNSILVADADRAANGDRRGRVAFQGEKYYFLPGSLSLMTQSDLYSSYILMGILVALALLLGFLLARYGVEEEFELIDTA